MCTRDNSVETPVCGGPRQNSENKKSCILLKFKLNASIFVQISKTTIWARFTKTKFNCENIVGLNKNTKCVE